jgi:hypothetical protein
VDDAGGANRGPSDLVLGPRERRLEAARETLSQLTSQVALPLCLANAFNFRMSESWLRWCTASVSSVMTRWPGCDLPVPNRSQPKGLWQRSSSGSHRPNHALDRPACPPGTHLSVRSLAFLTLFQRQCLDFNEMNWHWRRQRVLSAR